MIKFNRIAKTIYKTTNTKLRFNLFSENLTNSIAINNLSFKRFSENNYKDKFKSFAKDQDISPEIAQVKKEEEDKKLKDSFEDAKRKYEEDSKKKKELFEKIQRNENIDGTNNNTDGGIEIDLSLSKLKTKFSHVFTKIKSVKLSKYKKDQAEEIKKENLDNVKENIREKNETKQENENKATKDEASTENKQEHKVEKKDFFGKKFINGFMDVWHKTFPGEENIEALFERRREEARVLKDKIKDPTEEEIQKVKF